MRRVLPAVCAALALAVAGLAVTVADLQRELTALRVERPASSSLDSTGGPCPALRPPPSLAVLGSVQHSDEAPPGPSDAAASADPVAAGSPSGQPEPDSVV